MAAPDPIGVYVHWPFCLAKCPYCDFNSHVRAAIDQAGWRAALLAELDHAASKEASERAVATVFFGGGTPSLMDPAIVGAVLDTIAARFALADDVEVTLEANPTSVEAARFTGFRAAGVNRVSIGVQALDDDALRLLGRHHSASEAARAVDLACAIFPRASLDLIYARPGQTPDAWRAELARALAFGTTHVSAYQLTIEPGTHFHGLHRQGALPTLDEDVAITLWETTQDILAGAGFRAYEVSNHARPGEECRHNLIYWLAGDWIGLGPGAHGRIGEGAGRRAIVRARLPETWRALVAAHGHGTESTTVLDPDDAVEEALLMGLRLDEGIARDRFARATGRALDDALRADRLAPLVAGGFVVADAAGIRATARGRAVLNSVIAHLV